MSRCVSLENFVTSRLTVDKDWTEMGNESWKALVIINPQNSWILVGNADFIKVLYFTFRAFPLKFKTRMSFKVCVVPQSVSTRVRSVRRLSDRSRYCRFFSRWDVRQGITNTWRKKPKLINKTAVTTVGSCKVRGDTSSISIFLQFALQLQHPSTRQTC